MTLSTELRSHVIVFFDKSYKYISEERATNIMNLSTLPSQEGQIHGFKLDGNMYKFSSVSKIITVADFQKEYPDLVAKERESDKPNYTYPDGVPKTENKYSGGALDGMLKGINQYIVNNKTTGKAEAVRDMIKKAQREKSKFSYEYKNIMK